mmetsp:Transcript_55571/g.118345  ORF Transcript_55571/g.118345 Transcript_55571/m.118345 type:complete len:226 (-) Transcript_55571:318-995(-)
MLARPRDLGDSFHTDTHDDDDDEDDYRNVEFATGSQTCNRNTHGALAVCMMAVLLGLIVDLRINTANHLSVPTTNEQGCLRKSEHTFSYCASLKKCVHKYLEPCPGGIGECRKICHAIDLGDTQVAECSSKDATIQQKLDCARKLHCNCDNNPDCQKICEMKARDGVEKDAKECITRDCLDSFPEVGERKVWIDVEGDLFHWVTMTSTTRTTTKTVKPSASQVSI